MHPVKTLATVLLPALVIAITNGTALPYSGFGTCNNCHIFNDDHPEGAAFHDAHEPLPCIELDCNYCHRLDPALQRSTCDNCHTDQGLSRHHQCAGGSTSCVNCHGSTPPAEDTDVAGCLVECGDGLDNDGDCLYDGDDPDCEAPPEVCDNGVDDDGDGLVDCDDPDCLGVIPERCDDGVDNDCDGLADGEDSDCTCSDRDGDGYGDPPSGACASPLPDCDDSDPQIHPGHPEVPGNGKDDDCDGGIDEPCFVGTVLFD